MTDLHSCNFGCQRPACVHRQRDELWGYVSEIYNAVLREVPDYRGTLSNVMEFVVEERKALKEKCGMLAEDLVISQTKVKCYESVEALNKDRIEDFKARLAAAIEQMPFSDTAASFAQFVRDFK